jgi:F0F1-type ATP synthase beta subunit
VIFPIFSKRSRSNAEGKEPLVLEVQKHIGNNWVRTVAMDATDGLQRGVPAFATGAPIMVPVGHPRSDVFSTYSAKTGG